MQNRMGFGGGPTCEISWLIDWLIDSFAMCDRFILHGLISQIPLFWNYENDIHAYIKLREKKNTIWKLELFEWKLDFWNLFENWSPE